MVVVAPDLVTEHERDQSPSPSTAVNEARLLCGTSRDLAGAYQDDVEGRARRCAWPERWRQTEIEARVDTAKRRIPGGGGADGERGTFVVAPWHRVDFR